MERWIIVVYVFIGLSSWVVFWTAAVKKFPKDSPISRVLSSGMVAMFWPILFTAKAIKILFRC